MGVESRESAKRLPRVLVLPGFAQSSEIFRAKAASFISESSPFVEFEYAEPLLKIQRHDMKDALSWYDCDVPVDVDWYDFAAAAPKWSRYQESLAYLDQIFASKGPFDGIMGFSQGGAVAVTLCALLQRGQAPPHVNFRFACIASGFLGKDTTWWTTCTAQKITNIPSLHFIGRSDTIIRPDRSKEAAKCFEHAKVVEHPRAHMVPVDAAAREEFCRFVATHCDPQHGAGAVP